MAESSLFWTTGGAGDGASTYSRDQLRLLIKSLGGQNPSEGVLGGILNSLRPTSPGAGQVRIDTGRAVVDGTLYENTASVTKAITTPSSGTTGKRLVLRKSWAAQTVRVTETTSADGTSAIPPLVQIDGTTWDLPLCSFTIAPSTGAIGALVDNRAFVNGVAVQFIIDGAGAAIGIGQKGFLKIPRNLHLYGWEVLAEPAGSIVIDVWKDTYAAFPPVVGDSICGADKPTLAAVAKNRNVNVATAAQWNTVLNADDVLAINVDSVATVQRATLILYCAG